MSDLLLIEYLQRGIKPSTQKRETFTLNRYITYLRELTGNPLLNFEDLIEQAEDDIDNIPRERKRRIDYYLKSYHTYLDQSGLSLNTVHREFTTIRGFYRYFRINPPDIKKKFTIKPCHETIDDIPTKDHLIQAVNLAGLKDKAIILLMATSGMDAITLSSLKVSDLIRGIQDYIEYDPSNFTRPDFIKTCRLQDNGDIIPYWEGYRPKTEDKEIKYYTFSSPESFTAILDYLEYPQRKSMTPESSEDYLFPGQKGRVSYSNIQRCYKTINDTMDWPRLDNGIRFFHSHAMRKFFSNVLEDNEIGGRSHDYMMGHAPPRVKGSYTKPKKKRLLVQYKKCLEDLSMEKVRTVDITPAQIKELVRESEHSKEETQALREENRAIRENQEKIMKALEDKEKYEDFKRRNPEKAAAYEKELKDK